MKEPKSIEIFAPGSVVLLCGPDGDNTAVVSGVQIQSGRIAYGVVYWVGSDRREIWVEEFEVAATSATQRMRIGFKEA